MLSRSLSRDGIGPTTTTTPDPPGCWFVAPVTADMTAFRFDISVGDPQGVASGDVDGVSV